MRREFLQLAETFNPLKHNVAGYLISEKLDGTRSFWDGGLSRGQPTESIPWANVIDPKTGGRKAKIKPIATGLWSRYGNPIMAPDWFLNCLPCCPLDGELWAGRGNFQLCRSICAGDEPDARFDQIQFAIYSSPAPMSIFGSGEIKNANMHVTFNAATMAKWLSPQLSKIPDFQYLVPPSTFDQELLFLREAIPDKDDRVFLHRQVRLPQDEEMARAEVERFLGTVLDQGGEGCVIRDPNSCWIPKRHKGLLKYKPFDDAEAEVIGFCAGKEGRIGQALGKIGTLLVRTLNFDKNVEFEIGSGLTLAQREFACASDRSIAMKCPGQPMPNFVEGKHFKVGDVVTFKYRELTDEGIPKEGRYWRKRDTE